MKENLWLYILLTVSIIDIFIPSFWEGRKKTNRLPSELHARDRYAVAKKLEKELKQ